MNTMKEWLCSKWKWLLSMYSFGIMFAFEVLPVGAVGELIEGGGDKVGSEANTAITGIAPIAVLIVGILVAIGKKDKAKEILICAVVAFFCIRFYKEIGQFLGGLW